MLSHHQSHQSHRHDRGISQFSIYKKGRELPLIDEISIYTDGNLLHRLMNAYIQWRYDQNRILQLSDLYFCWDINVHIPSPNHQLETKVYYRHRDIITGAILQNQNECLPTESIYRGFSFNFVITQIHLKGELGFIFLRIHGKVKVWLNNICIEPQSIHESHCIYYIQPDAQQEDHQLRFEKNCDGSHTIQWQSKTLHAEAMILHDQVWKPVPWQEIEGHRTLGMHFYR
jgi:hypothetical protein